jgi:phosphotransferase system  glucose/maltose/N-acetylglucosamine-specific IIC component
MRAVRFGAILGIAGVAAHSLVDFGLHIMTNAVVFLTLIMIATTELSPAKAQRRKGAKKSHEA